MPRSGLLEGLGRVTARTTIASAGWSGNRIDRLTMEDGRSLIAKRIWPGADWIGRGTRDRGREALLFAEGAFARMPPELDPADDRHRARGRGVVGGNTRRRRRPAGRGGRS